MSSLKKVSSIKKQLEFIKEYGESYPGQYKELHGVLMKLLTGEESTALDLMGINILER